MAFNGNEADGPQARNPLRVTIVTTSFPLNETAVSGPFIMEMARHLPEDIHATVMTPCGVDRVNRLTLHGYQVRCFRYAPRAWQILTHGPGGLPAALRENHLARLLLIPFLPALFLACLGAARNADLIHANWSATGLIAGLAGRLTGTPCITTLRGSDVALAERSRLFRAVLWICARLNQRLVAVGEGLRERIAQILVRDAARITLIPNGVDERFFLVPLPVVPERLRLLTVGSLVPVKGIDCLFEALALLDPKLDWELTLVGDGPERVRLEVIARTRGIAERIRFAGMHPPAAIPSVLAEHDVFLLTSRSEGRPNALIEAMAAGRAVIASNIPAVTELIADGDNGLLFPMDDTAALTSRLERLISDPHRIPELGRRARESVATMSWTETGQRYAALYREVLDNR